VENHDDPKLSELLQEWRVPGAPESLDRRISALRRPWWAFLLTGSIRIPVPVGLAIAGILITMAAALFRQKPEPVPASGSVSLLEFRPVHDLNLRVIRHDEAH